MTRLGRHLERHGLSFGDALNIALFLLTIASLYLAYQAVRIARETLDDARTQAIKAAHDQDEQFKKQMEQLQVVTDELNKSSNLLSDQSHILKDVQDTSRQQLKDLNAAEARLQRQERATPKPRIVGLCFGRGKFVDTSTKPSRIVEEPNLSYPKIVYETTIKALSPDPFKNPSGLVRKLPCLIDFTNEGDAELKNAKFTIWLQAAGEECGSTFFSARMDGVPFPIGLPKPIFVNVTIPSRSQSKKDFSTDLDIALDGPCRYFILAFTLESDNSNKLDVTVNISVEDFRHP